MRWKATAGYLAVATLLAAVACDPSSPPQPPRGEGQPAPAAAVSNVSDATARAPAPEINGAREGGTLTILTRQVPETFDPTRSSYVDTTMVLRLVTRALTQYRYDPDARKMVLVPDLATDLGRPNADFTEWEFTLREGIAYEDGTEVKAEDVAYALRRQFASEELGGGPLYGQDYFLGGEEYTGPFKPESAGGGDDFEAVETPDDRTIVIKMRRPFADMMFYASFPNFAPIPADRDTGVDYGRHPLGTGPYKFEKYVPGRELTLTRNEHWDPQTDPGRHQYLERFHFKFGQSPVELQDRLIADAGMARNAATYDDLLAGLLPEAERTGALNRVVRSDRSCVFYAYMDMRKIPLEVRRALAVAYPIEELNRAGGFIPEVTAMPATTILPAAAPGRKEHDAIGRGGAGPPDYDNARSMLVEAGYEGFEIVTYYASDNPLEQDMADVREAELEQAGFSVKSVGVPTAKLRELLGDPAAPVNLRTQGWCADWPGGGSVFPAQWDPRNSEAPGAPNPSFINVDEVADEIDRIASLPTDEAMLAWGELDELLMKKYLPVIPLRQSAAAFLHGSNVANYRVDELLGVPDLSAVYLDAK